MESNLMPGYSVRELDQEVMTEEELIEQGYRIFFKDLDEDDCYDGE